MPVFYVKGVYHLMIDILLFLMLGNFHLTKIFLWCAEHYLTYSGVGDALIKGDVFGKKVLVSVMSNGHYARSLYGMLVLPKVFYSSAWEESWKTKSHDRALITLRRLYLISC